MNLRWEIKKRDTLYYIGDDGLLSKSIVAVIGKRDRSLRYARKAYEIGAQLAEDGYVVLNGLAIGCDTDAIKGALSKKGKVIAVLPCGLDQVYPASNRALAEQILENGGCIVSEYPVGTKPEKYRFVQRDKVQAKLANHVVVIETEKDGGTMHTVEYALQEQKPIACVVEEGEEHSPTGNAYLIKESIAVPITSIESLRDFLQQPKIKYEQISLFDICEE